MPVILKPQKYTGTVTSVKQESPRVKIFKIKLDREGFHFVPGQNVVLSFPSHVNDKGAAIKRVYSIASAPGEGLELCIAILPNGAISQKLDCMKPGDTLTVEGPYGAFQIRDPPGPRVNLIAGGTGIAPLMSILRHCRAKHPATHVSLFFGFRNVNDFLYREEIEKHRAGSHFTLHTSASGKDADWPTKGHITDHLSGHIQHADTYICGPHAMVLETRKKLGELGFPQEKIIYEEW